MERFISKYVGDRDNRRKYRKDLKIAFDVDMTLIDHNDRPIYDNIQVMMWFIDRGYDVYIWSGGGLWWAFKIVRQLGLEDIVKVIEKGFIEVDLAFDDEKVELGKLNIEV